MIIREFKKEDAEAVAPLIHQLTPNIVEPDKLVERLANMSAGENYKYFVAEVEGKVVGFAGLTWYPIPSKGLVGWLEEVVVDENYRGQGIAKLLVAEVLKLAQKIKLQQVKTTTANSVANQVYAKAGFVKKDEDLLIIKYYNQTKV